MRKTEISMKHDGRNKRSFISSRKLLYKPRNEKTARGSELCPEISMIRSRTHKQTHTRTTYTQKRMKFFPLKDAVRLCPTDRKKKIKLKKYKNIKKL